MESIFVFNKTSRRKLIVKRAGFFSKGFGLMFRPSGTSNLLFEFKKNVNLSITSLFVFFPFLAIWLDDENKVLGIKIVQPFISKINATKKFRKLIEVPFNEKNKGIIDFFVDNGEKFKYEGIH